MIQNGSLKIGRVGGVDLLIHWSWLLLLYYWYSVFQGSYTSPAWVFGQIGIIVVMVLFAEVVHVIFGVLAHGTVSRIYVSFLGRGSDLTVPERPGPIMFSNLGAMVGYAAMLGLTIPLFWQTTTHGLGGQNTRHLCRDTMGFNLVLLAWTIIPVYPLPGGRIVRAVLWLMMGRIRSLQVSCVLGVLGVLGIVAIAVWLKAPMIGIGAIFMGIACFQGFREAKFLGMLEKVPRRPDIACPHCKQHPFYVHAMQCPCGNEFDPFETRGQCPRCNSVLTLVPCSFCGQRSAISTWLGSIRAFEVQMVEPSPTSHNLYLRKTL